MSGEPFTPLTYKTRTFPKKTPTVAQVVLWIAKLGGFLGRKSDGPPRSDGFMARLATVNGYFQYFRTF